MRSCERIDAADPIRRPSGDKSVVSQTPEPDDWDAASGASVRVGSRAWVRARPLLPVDSDVRGTSGPPRRTLHGRDAPTGSRGKGCSF